MIAAIAIEDGNQNNADDEDDESNSNDDFQSPRNLENDDENLQQQQQQQQPSQGQVEKADVSPSQSPSNTAALEGKEEQPKKEEAAVVSKSTTMTKTSNKKNPQQQQVDEPEGPPQPPAIKLYKSTRFKGYLTIALASIINQNAATLSSDPAYVNAVPSSPKQQNYAQTVSIISAIISGICVVLHLDRYTVLRDIWSKKLFSPKSKIELLLIGFLCLWWSVAVIVQTGVRGIAGDGKEQYNLYCSTWLCCYCAFWTMERKLLEFGYTTFRTFVMAWPYRAPGWIAIFLTDFFTLFWYVDLFINTSKNPDRVAEPLQPFYSNIPQSQYQWLIFVAAFTLLPSGVFIFAELVRQNRAGSTSDTGTYGIRERIARSSSQDNNKKKHVNIAVSSSSLERTTGTSTDGGADADTGAVQQSQKPHLELILEGFCLFLLVASWIPCCVVATTPGGFASLIGNAYFFTWATTIYVVETFLWFIHDFRGNVHKSIEQSELEYKRHQQEVLEKSRQYMNNNNINERLRRMSNEDDVDEEEINFVNDFDYDENNNKNIEAKQRNGDGDVHGEEGGEDEEHWKMYMSPTSRGIHSPARYQMSYEDGEDDNIIDANDNDDDSIKQELRLKQTNTDEYFETLNDILE